MAGFGPIKDRLDRADCQVEKLHARTTTWVENQNLQIAYDHDVQSGVYTIWIEGYEEPPSSLGLIVGEVAHNLRAALDNTVYDLAIRNSGQPSPKNRLQFPIVSCRADWKPQGGSDILGLSQKAIIAIENLQPFKFDDRPNALEVLAAINDIDKHRLVHPAIVRVADWVPRVVRSDPRCSLHFQRNLSDRSIGKTAVRYRVKPPHAQLEFDQEAQLPLQVGFGDRSSLIHCQQLKVLSQEVRRIVEGLASLVGETL